jgi:predicted alpha/beta superfamily hydrolase
MFQSTVHHQAISTILTTTCFGQLTIIRPSPQYSQQRVSVNCPSSGHLYNTHNNVFRSTVHHQAISTKLTTTTCFGQLSIIRPSPQYSQQRVSVHCPSSGHLNNPHNSVLRSTAHHQAISTTLTTTTCFGQLSIIRPSLQYSKQRVSVNCPSSGHLYITHNNNVFRSTVHQE